MKTIMIIVTASAVALSLGCASPQYQANQNMINNAAIGAALGAAAGSIIGNNSHGSFERGDAAIAGALIGGLMGGTMGRQQDRFDAQMASVSELASTVVINVENSNGSITPVTLRRVGNQYLGPRGEYYAFLPNAEQLRVAYGF